MCRLVRWSFRSQFDVNRSTFDEDVREERIFTFSFPVTLTLDLYLDHKLTSIVSLFQRYVFIILEVSTAFLLRENWRQGTNGQTDGQTERPGATINAASREGEIIMIMLTPVLCFRDRTDNSVRRSPCCNEFDEHLLVTGLCKAQYDATAWRLSFLSRGLYKHVKLPAIEQNSKTISLLALQSLLAIVLNNICRLLFCWYLIIVIKIFLW